MGKLKNKRGLTIEITGKEMPVSALKAIASYIEKTELDLSNGKGTTFKGGDVIVSTELKEVHRFNPSSVTKEGYYRFDYVESKDRIEDLTQPIKENFT